jgi:iron complex outermembrane receptor protein
MTRFAPFSRTALAVALAAASTSAFAAAEPAAPAVAPAADTEDAGGSDIIVTGTRASGITVAESAAPIKVLSPEMIQHVGQPNLNQILTQLVPSFNAAAFGGDTAELTLSARLRGLSPNHTLVLVNGKRRHGTANLAVLPGVTQGGAAPDLDFIPPAAIGRIEVLEDGAAAQYGSDAIAGVINIITKHDAEGGAFSATAGQYYKGDGAIYSGSGNVGMKIGEAGWLNLTGMYRFHNRSQVGGIDRRLSTPDSSLKPGLSPAQVAAYQNIPGYPYVNKIFGDPKSTLYSGSYDAGYDYGDIQVYSFGTYGHRTASAIENFRVPDRVIASPTLGVSGTFTTPGELIFAPQGFDPKEAFREDDFSTTGGVKGDTGGWHWDLSTTYGRDKDRIYTKDSANASLYVDTHFTPTSFYDGAFTNSEFTANADFSRELDLGMAAPTNIAFGAEYRKNLYQIQSGDPGSIYKEGGQSYPGFQPTDAGSHTRDNEAAYLDVALTPIEHLKIDGAVRYEHYSDFGSKVIGKITGRYDFTPAFALRGTISNGFRAPTQAEEYYSATNVSPTSATVQLPANSAAAKLIGFQNLKPEKSTNYSFGTVLRPVDRVTITIDAYQISIKDRIIGTGTIFGRGGTNADPTLAAKVLAAIAAHGNVLDSQVTQVGAAAFTNGVNTRTRGVDVTMSYALPTSIGHFDLTLSGNYNDNKITHIDPQFAALIDDTARSTLEHSSPKFKVIGGAFWSLDQFSATVRETLYGKSYILYSPSGGAIGSPNYIKNQVGTAALTDIELGYKITKDLKISFGANNLFNKKPPQVALALNQAGVAVPTLSTAGNVYDAPDTFSAYGINGGFYYARLDVSF